MSNIMNDTWNFVFNLMKFSKANNEQIKSSSILTINPYRFYKELDKLVKKELNISNLSDIFNPQQKFITFEKYNLYDELEILYTQTELLCLDLRDKQKKLSLLLFNLCLTRFLFKKRKIIKDFNTIISKYNLYFEKSEFYSLSPISKSNLNIINDILNLSNSNKKKYSNVLETYNEAHHKFNDNEYSEVILYSFSALESLVKIILQHEKLSIETNFKKNITKLLTINKFNQFKLQSYFESLSCIRNNHSAHGNIHKHIEDINLSKFYLYSIGNTIVYIINTYES